MDEQTLRRIATLEATIDHLMDDEGTDSHLIAEMASTFLMGMRTGDLNDLAWYIRMYSHLDPNEVRELVEVVNTEVEHVVKSCPHTDRS